MINSKYNKILTVILVIVIIVIFALLGFWGYQTFTKYFKDKDIDATLDKFNETILSNNTSKRNEFTGSEPINFTAIDNGISNNTSSGGSTSNVVTYEGFTVVGRMEIPKIDLDLPVLERATKLSLEESIGVLMGPGLNQVGNTIIVGHNYRNRTFFSRNSELENGDEIYITDNSGTKIEYTIYNIYTTSSEDSDYITRDTAGKREVSLSTCTEDSRYRLVIWAREVE